jgi:DNA polymerase III epsilon subunit
MDEIIVLDVETTGLDPLQDKIVEIALLKISNGIIVEKLVTLLNPGIPIPKDAVFIHGITNRMVKNCPFFIDIAQKVFDFINGKILLVHNADFDISFIKKELKLCNMKLPNIKIIDTLTIARNYFNFPSNSLPKIAEYFNIPFPDSHRAEADALMTYKIYCKMQEELQKRKKGVKMYKESVLDIPKNIDTKTNKKIKENLWEKILNFLKMILR